VFNIKLQLEHYVKLSPSWIYWHTHSINLRHINLCTEREYKGRKKEPSKSKRKTKRRPA